ncbi:MAG: DsrE/DsrF/DrsH-like family protein [Planctomycetota bacterium]|nr:DsrE/DsrF/DrsH-like family protein [Planctomycetota bacterium]
MTLADEHTPASAATGGEAAEKKLTLIAHSGDLDKLLATMSLACTAAAMGTRVHIFFTFWGVMALRKHRSFRGKSALHRMLNALLPSRARRLPLSRKNMAGMGPVFFRHLMGKKNVANVDDLVAVAKDCDVRLIACAMSMDVMGIHHDELVDGVEIGGAVACVGDLLTSDSSFLI